MDYIERMENELEELVKKGIKADKALNELDLTKEEYAMLYTQTRIMCAYIDILDTRIRYAKTKGKQNRINENIDR